MRWKLFVPASLALLALGLSAQYSRHQLDQPKTLTSVETLFNDDGSLKATTYIRRTWRADGSEASDSVRVVNGLPTDTHTRTIRDHATMRSMSLYFDLGVVTIARLPETTTHDLHVRAEDCSARVSEVGVAADDDPFLRVVSDGEIRRTLRFDPGLGCQIVETVVEASGRIVSRTEVKSMTDGTDETLFRMDPDLKPVTRVGLMQAFEAKYDAPLFDGPVAEGIVSNLDATNPLLLDED